VGEEGVEVNEIISEYYFYWKRERLMKIYEWTKSYSSFRKIQNGVTSTTLTNTYLNQLLSKIVNKTAPTENGKNLLKILEVSIKYELEKRDTQVQLNELEATADLLLVYWEIGLEVTPFQASGQWLWSVTTYWVWYVTNDSYLEAVAKQNLQNDLLLVAQELNPSKKFKKLMNLGKSVKIAKTLARLDYSKILNDMPTRWWTTTSIESIIKSPKKIWKSVNNYEGANNPVTVYYNSNYEHIVVDDVTWKIVQISNKNDVNWIMNSRIYDLKDF
jgi:hypothetical protein